ncbi:MAG: hypothetical protein HYS81_04355 [Candidatus Aenigmatarchaeota archaeon]|nr:MAG: hypothetical protein HYS81_04355 [Candidatus Aenigmarchaeota archaeon]
MRLQVLDADYTMLDNKPLMRIFCKRPDGKSVCVFYRNFLPYLYALPRGSDEDVTALLRKRFGGELLNVERVERFLPIGYNDTPAKLLKITLRTPSKVPEAKEALASIAELYEADVLFRYRFFSDFGIGGMGWIDVEGSNASTSTVYCPVIEATSITPVQSEENVPLRYMSLDIECVPLEMAGIAGAEKDPIIMMSLIFEPGHKDRRSVVLASRLGITNAECYPDEKQMLQAFIDVVRAYDPDVLVGYNIQNFDLPYILKRLEIHGLERKLGRADKTTFTRTMVGKQATDVIGRVVADPYVIIRKPDISTMPGFARFKRYDLNTVAHDLLGEEKIKIDHKEMRDAWLARQKMETYVEYCRKDAALALNILLKYQMMDKYVAIARLSGITLQDSINGGQSTRIENLLLNEFNRRGFVMPLKPGDEEDAEREAERGQTEYKGGLVLEPEKGLHTDGCIAVLDFKSLYPSIIMTYNVCPTTLVRSDTNASLNVSPAGAKFVTADVREGILPAILGRLIDERAAVKKQMKSASGTAKAVLDAKQFALKMATNSFYGYTGYLRARIYVLDVANAITAYGRTLIEQTRDTIEGHGYKVVYGDTDSVMIKIPTRNLDEAYTIGNDLSREITESLPGRLELDFDKIFRSFLILTKKRYAGWSFEKTGDKWSDKIEMKGIETVRRDWCDLVSETMENVIETILKEGDIGKAMGTVKEQVERLKQGNVDIYKLAITKGLTKSTERYDGMLPHVELAKRMKKRGGAPAAGDRIQFVIVSGNALISQRAEDPEYIIQNKLRIDSDYYIGSQLLPPLERIFAVMGIERNELTGGGRQISLFEAMNGGKPQRKFSVVSEMNPDKAVVTNVEGFSCRSCKTTFRRVPILGKCDCGGEIYAYGGGMMGKTVAV